MERRSRNSQRRFPKLYALVEKAVGKDEADALMGQILDESRTMGDGSGERASYAYVALQRYLQRLGSASGKS